MISFSSFKQKKRLMDFDGFFYDSSYSLEYLSLRHNWMAIEILSSRLPYFKVISRKYSIILWELKKKKKILLDFSRLSNRDLRKGFLKRIVLDLNFYFIFTVIFPWSQILVFPFVLYFICCFFKHYHAIRWFGWLVTIFQFELKAHSHQ